ncbi:SDR family NAD(P)-dependent oxidoreductase [Pelagicoccus mobilis]|uniref:SDR family oxidoreductase n=1 Tax=Pelagicoccus mobilis TaxID=415221 RepID=A0A934RRY8_9BACT|nr:glucose 1-dehydrogenase [Pelagicoccus mobilis]MBK1876490.1 SDR family oxidoreductase [Pelagicoccus mobilis]
MRLENKKVVVTGAACGIGKAIAQRFAREGATVCILDINDGEAAKVVEGIREKGGNAHAFHCDVGDSAAVGAAFDAALETMGGIDVLINNTGVIRQSPVIETSEEDWDHIIKTNLKSVFLCTQRALKEMVAAGNGGRIVGISSIHSVLSEPNCCHYTASKGGMESFLRTVATEMAPHKITANFIRPGATYTELTVPMYTESVKNALYKRVPLAEIAEASWIANAALFLASDESRYMTGQDITIDGGFVMDGSLPDAEYWEE